MTAGPDIRISPTGSAALQQSVAQISIDRLAAHLAGRFTGVAAIREYSHGVAAQNFHVTLADGRELVARCDARRSPASAGEDRLFGTLVQRNGLATPTGPWSISTLDGITVVLRPHVGGTALPDLPPAAWPDGHRLGRMLARVHGTPAPRTERQFFYGPTYRQLVQQLQVFRQACRCLADIAAMPALMDHALARIDRAGDPAALLAASPGTLIHGDYTPPNLLSDGTTVHIIDWEKACLGPSYSDIAQAVYYFAAACPQSAATFAPSFVAGYGESAAVSPLMLRAWLTCHPAVIFLVDAIAAAKNRAASPAQFSTKRELYFRNTAAPRFQRFVAIADDVMAALGV